jgi:antitoxin PrlF
LIASKITSKAQTTVPRSVRAALKLGVGDTKLGVGDTIVYAIEGDHVIMTKATAATTDSPTATFDEWSSENDRHAYAGL